MLIRRVVATGPGLVLDATGRRTILGNFSFKGDATLTNLAAAHGAHPVFLWTRNRTGNCH